MTSQFKIGLTLGGIVDVTTLSADAIEPFGQFKNWTVVKDLGNGLALGQGRPWAFWTWGIAPPLLYNVLRGTYCPSPAKSARVFIQTLNSQNNGTYAIYEAALIWPDHENMYNSGGINLTYSEGNTSNFTLVFRDLVAQ
jgi:hypothetical protein